MSKESVDEFLLTADGFEYKGAQHAYDEIAEIFFQRVKTSQQLNFKEIGVADSAYLKLALKNHKEIELSVDESGLFMGFNKNKYAELGYLAGVYQRLSKLSFQSRVEQYVSQLESTGHFTYSKCLFNPQRQSITTKGTEYSVAACRLLKHNGYIVIERSNPSAMDKLKAIWEPPQFNTQTNTDVIFALLKHYFNLSWT